MTGRILLQGVALCNPFAQGDLDSLCGLYAAVNAICVISAPIRPVRMAEAHQLLHDGISYLHRRGLLHDALIDGMAIRRQHALTRQLAKSARCLTGLAYSAAPLVQDQSRLTVDFVLQLFAARIARGSAIIACLENTLWHYTVVTGVSDSRVSLFDSDGLQWIERRSLGICGAGDKTRHCVSLASLVEVCVVS